MKHLESSKMGLEGKIKVTLAKLEFPRQWNLHNEIIKRTKKGLPFIELVKELNRICKIRIFEYQNITTTVGRTMIMNNLCDASPDYTMLINYGAVGTGTTAVSEAQTQLVTENTRKLIASITNSTITGYITQFYTAAEAVASLKETGLFSNASATANSGIMVARALINITKQNTETLTVDWSIVLNDV